MTETRIGGPCTKCDVPHPAGGDCAAAAAAYDEEDRRIAERLKLVGQTGEECLIHVYWTQSEGQDGHRLRRGDRGADLGMSPPSPPFTNDEMESILFAAKKAALKCLRARKRKRL